MVPTIVEAAKILFNLLLDDESDSDDNDFKFEKLIRSRRKRRICAMKPVRLAGFVEWLLPACSDREFPNQFQMSRPAF